MAVTNPLKAIQDIRKEELPFSLFMSFYFFLVITGFWILKPLKKTIFIGFYDQTGFTLLGWHMNAAQAEQLAKVLNMVVAFLAVLVFTWLVRRMHRQQLTYVFTSAMIAGFLLYTFALREPTHLSVWGFYLFGDLFNTVMVASFFAFLNDSVAPETAKRLYGLIVLGGVVGGAFGSLVVKIWIENLSIAQWMWICIGISFVIFGLAAAAGRIVAKNPPPEKPTIVTEVETSKKKNLALEGARLVFKSPYLLSIVAIVGLYEIISTVMNFQFTSTAAHYLDGPAFDSHITTVYLITNIFGMVFQLLLTSYIMTRFGLKTALLILPAMIVLGSVGFIVLPVLWMGSFLNLENALNYSVNQSARESLYTPTSKDEKYKAKAFIDMFVMRFAKVIAIGVTLVTTSILTAFSTVKWLGLFSLAMVVIWIIAARYAGKRFKEAEESHA